MVTSKVNTIDHSELESSDKWLIKHFLSQPISFDSLSFNISKLKDLVIEKNETINPQKYPDWLFAYIGLENIESNTGFLTNFDKKTGKSIKSRTKIFYGGDLLFGKLRPSLNKVHLVESSFGGGICSTEFFVFRVRENVISPLVLRFLLSTQYVLSQVKSYTAGAALPRIHIKDLMNISVPIPSLEIISQLEDELKKINSDLQKGRDLYLNSSRINEKLFESYFSDKENMTSSVLGVQSSEPLKGILPF